MTNTEFFRLRNAYTFVLFDYHGHECAMSGGPLWHLQTDANEHLRTNLASTPLNWP